MCAAARSCRRVRRSSDRDSRRTACSLEDRVIDLAWGRGVADALDDETLALKRRVESVLGPPTHAKHDRVDVLDLATSIRQWPTLVSRPLDEREQATKRRISAATCNGYDNPNL